MTTTNGSRKFVRSTGADVRSLEVEIEEEEEESLGVCGRSCKFSYIWIFHFAEHRSLIKTRVFLHISLRWCYLVNLLRFFTRIAALQWCQCHQDFAAGGARCASRASSLNQQKSQKFLHKCNKLKKWTDWYTTARGKSINQSINQSLFAQICNKMTVVVQVHREQDSKAHNGTNSCPK